MVVVVVVVTTSEFRGYNSSPGAATQAGRVLLRMVECKTYLVILLDDCPPFPVCFHLPSVL